MAEPLPSDPMADALCREVDAVARVRRERGSAAVLEEAVGRLGAIAALLQSELGPAGAYDVVQAQADVLAERIMRERAVIGSAGAPRGGR